MLDAMLPTRALGQQGLVVSALGLGCMGDVTVVWTGR
jgi:aryl-alcohol dehydrogenase-like predicted oxidoreductase